MLEGLTLPEDPFLVFLAPRIKCQALECMQSPGTVCSAPRRLAPHQTTPQRASFRVGEPASRIVQFKPGEHDSHSHTHSWSRRAERLAERGLDPEVVN
jgi:hypothetical protein